MAPGSSMLFVTYTIEKNLCDASHQLPKTYKSPICFELWIPSTDSFFTLCPRDNCRNVWPEHCNLAFKTDCCPLGAGLWFFLIHLLCI